MNTGTRASSTKSSPQSALEDNRRGPPIFDIAGTISTLATGDTQQKNWVGGARFHWDTLTR